MNRFQIALTQPSEDDGDHDQELAHRLFGDPVKEVPIVNAELGIFPMDDDD
jgi:hypothetical protein